MKEIEALILCRVNGASRSLRRMKLESWPMIWAPMKRPRYGRLERMPTAAMSKLRTSQKNVGPRETRTYRPQLLAKSHIMSASMGGHLSMSLRIVTIM